MATAWGCLAVVRRGRFRRHERKVAVLPARFAQLAALAIMTLSPGFARGDIVMMPSAGAASSHNARTSDARGGLCGPAVQVSDSRSVLGEVVAERGCTALWSLQVETAAATKADDAAAALLIRPVGVDMALLVTVLCGFGGALVLRPSGLAVDPPRAEVVKYCDVYASSRDTRGDEMVLVGRVSLPLVSVIAKKYLGIAPARGPPGS